MRSVEFADLEEIEMALLLEGIHRRYGYDFSGYATQAMAGPVRNIMRREGLQSLSGLLDRMLHDPECMTRFLHEVSGSSAGSPNLFSTPSFYLTLRSRVAPLLRTYPSVRIWVAGCGAGWDVYALAILLREERLEDRCELFATDLDDAVLARARAGRFPGSAAEALRRDYHRAGGQGRFEEYFTIDRGEGVLDPGLTRKTVFATHFPVTDGPFNEFQLILCREAWTRFGVTLQQRFSEVLHRSLALLGFLALGPGEPITVSPYALCYEEFSAGERLYRRMR